MSLLKSQVNYSSMVQQYITIVSSASDLY